MMNAVICESFLYINLYSISMLIIDANYIFDGVECFCLLYNFNELFFQIVVVNVLFFIGV